MPEWTPEFRRRGAPGALGLSAFPVPLGVHYGVHDRSLAIVRRPPDHATINKMFARGWFSVPMQSGVSSDDYVRMVFLEQPIEKSIGGGALPEEFIHFPRRIRDRAKRGTGLAECGPPPEASLTRLCFHCWYGEKCNHKRP